MTTLLDPTAREFYCHTLRIFREAHLPVLIGGAYAFARYTGIERHTKDLDVFVREEHFQPTLDALEKAGYTTETAFPHWLGKAHHGEFFVDVIFGSGNGIARVDDEWFTHAATDHVVLTIHGVPSFRIETTGGLHEPQILGWPPNIPGGQRLPDAYGATVPPPKWSTTVPT